MSSREVLYFVHGAVRSPTAERDFTGWGAGSARGPDAAADRQEPGRAERLHVVHRGGALPRHGEVDPIEPFSYPARGRPDPDLQARRPAPQCPARGGHQCAVSEAAENDPELSRVRRSPTLAQGAADVSTAHHAQNKNGPHEAGHFRIGTGKVRTWLRG